MKLNINSVCFLFIFLSSLGHAGEIKKHPKPAFPKSKMWSYKVIKGDSFESIYQKYLDRRIFIEPLSQLNKHQLNKKLQPGQVIVIPLEMLKKEPVPVEVIAVSGDVKTGSIFSNDMHSVDKGVLLAVGSSLITGRNSVARLRFADGSLTDVQPNSNISIHSSYRYAGVGSYVIDLKLTNGRAQTNANPNHLTGNHLQIKTPSAIAAVRGTDFRVSTTGDVTIEETLEGKVGLKGNDKEVLIPKDFGSKVEKDKAPLPPIPLLDAPDISQFPKLINQMPALFSLKSQPNVKSYIAQLFSDENLTQIVNEIIIPVNGKLPTEVKLVNLSKGKYYLKLRAQDQEDIQGKEAVHAFEVTDTEALPPEILSDAPQLIEPLDAATIMLAPNQFSWEQLPAAEGYLLQIARDADFENKIYELVAPSNQLTINNSFGEGHYFWRVAVLRGGKPQKFTASRTFKR